MRALLTTGLMVILFAAAAFASGADELVRQGLEKMKAGEWEAALLKLKDAQIERPDSAELQFDIGICLYKLERWEEADTALTAALFSSNRDIEKKAAFHLGNVAVKRGKFKEALDHYDRALKIDPNYTDAKVNREYVVRKVKELARKEKEKKEKENEERAVVEKLKEIIAAQTEAHGMARFFMRLAGFELPPSKISELASALDQALPESRPDPATLKAEEPGALQEVGTAQGGILEKAKALVQEVQKKVAAATSQPADPNAPPVPPDPEKEKLERAAPFLVAALGPLEGAQRDATTEKDWKSLNGNQEAALIQLLKALNELLDELTRIILDQVQVIKETAAAAETKTSTTATTRPTPESRPSGEQLLSPVGEDEAKKPLDQRQDGLRDRTRAFAGGVEQALKAMQAEAAKKAKEDPAASQPNVAPGQSPEDEAKRYEKALGHLNQAAQEMTNASGELRREALEPAVELESKALEELNKAKQALSPPDQQGDQQQKGEKQEKEKEEEKKDGDSNQQKPDEQKPEEQKDQMKDEKKKDEKLSKDQEKKTLERAKQRERDQRRENKEENKRAQAVGGSGVGKDW